MSSSPILLPRLQQLEAEGLNLGVLALMQQRAVAEAIRMREAKGFTAHPSADVRDLADGNLPRGEALMQAYIETRAGATRESVSDLQRAGRTLALYAENLERTAARLQARNLTLPEFARAQQAVGERYARIMDGARALESRGVVPIHHSEKLGALTARPQGPLAGYYDKAVALSQHEQSQERTLQRMRG